MWERDVGSVQVSVIADTLCQSGFGGSLYPTEVVLFLSVGL